MFFSLDRKEPKDQERMICSTSVHSPWSRCFSIASSSIVLWCLH